jgi:hypothetical protein
VAIVRHPLHIADREKHVSGQRGGLRASHQSELLGLQA